MSSKKSEQTCRRPVLVISSQAQFCDIKLLLPEWFCLHCDKTELTRVVRSIQKFDINVIILTFDSIPQRLLDSLAKIAQQHPALKWIAILSAEQLQNTRTSPILPKFFYDYHHFPIDPDRLNHTIGHASGLANMQVSRPMAQTISSPLDAIIGHSGVIKTFKQQIELVAKVDSCVLITGETGTGKDLAALTIHKLSSRACKPFININCAAFPEHLIQSELFGHEKGAFTGAVNQHIGKIEQAEGGTLFLNEIGDLPISLQAVLLKFLDDQCIERIGGTKCFRIDCRIIAATHVDLTTKIEQNLFRDDLYYRLNTLPLYAPPLRKRKNDIVLLGQKFCDDIARENGTPVKTLSLNQDAINYSWPGNIRELKSYVIRTALLNDTDTLKSFFHENLSTNKKHKQTESIKPVHDCKRTGNSIKTRSGIDKKTLIDAIKVNHYNISATARSLNISRTTCYRLMKKCNIKIS